MIYSTYKNKNGVWYLCVDCAFDTQAKDDMRLHCMLMTHGEEEVEVDEAEYIRMHRGTIDRSVLFSVLVWNQGDVAVQAVRAAVQEARRLDDLLVDTTVLVLMNGCNEATSKGIDFLHTELKRDGKKAFQTFTYEQNVGNSVSRNDAIKKAVKERYDYLFMLDGDISVVPLSSWAMLRRMEKYPDLMCLGADSNRCTANPEEASHCLYDIPESRIRRDSTCAFTQYGIFRTEVFKRGARFCEDGPFGGPGWGFEDDDLGLQIICCGYRIEYFTGITYLHQNRRSSLKTLQENGHNTKSLFNARKDHLVSRWGSFPAATKFINIITNQEYTDV